MSRRARFTQADVKRALNAARSAGFSQVRLEIDPMGNIALEASDTDIAPMPRINPLDRLLVPR